MKRIKNTRFDKYWDRHLDSEPNWDKTYWNRDKTNIFGVINGGGRGDGVPRGQLQLVDANFVPSVKPWFFWNRTKNALTVILLKGLIEFRSETLRIRSKVS